MPQWNKIITSGSNAQLNSVFVTNAVTASFFYGTSSWAESASWAPGGAGSSLGTGFSNGGGSGSIPYDTNVLINRVNFNLPTLTYPIIAFNRLYQYQSSTIPGTVDISGSLSEFTQNSSGLYAGTTYYNGEINRFSSISSSTQGLGYYKDIIGPTGRINYISDQAEEQYITLNYLLHNGIPSYSLQDLRNSPIGMTYFSDYGNSIKTNSRSIPDVGTIANYLTSSYAITSSYYQESKSFGVTIDGGGSTISTGVKGDIVIPFNCYIDSWYLVADQVGSIVIDVWKDILANHPPTVSDSIAGTEKPTLSSVIQNSDTNLTTWSKAVTSGDVIRFNVDSASSVTKVTLTIKAFV